MDIGTRSEWWETFYGGIRKNRENKKPDSGGESGLAKGSAYSAGVRVFQRFTIRRQADPCQRARLPAVMETVAETTTWRELSIGFRTR